MSSILSRASMSLERYVKEGCALTKYFVGRSVFIRLFSYFKRLVECAKQLGMYGRMYYRTMYYVQYSFISSSVSVSSDLTRKSSFNRTSTRISSK